MAGRKKYGLVSGPWPDQWKLIGSCGTKPRPGTYGRHLSQPRHIFLRTFQHTHEHEVINFLMLGTVLPGRSDKDLASAARLHIKRDRITADGVSALQVTEFHQLMPDESGIAIRDDQM